MISVTGKVIGKKKPLFADFGVDLPPQFERGDGGVTLRDVLDKIVRAQLAAFQQRCKGRLKSAAGGGRKVQHPLPV